MFRSTLVLRIVLSAALLVPLIASAQENIDITTGYTAPPKQADLDELERLAKLVMAAEYDYSQAAPIENLEVSRDTGRVLMKKGWVFLREPVEGLISAAVFFGEGQFTLKAPIPMERGQFIRYLDQESIDQEITRANFSFTSLELQNLFEGLEYSAEEAAKAREKYDSCDSWAKSIEKAEDRQLSREQLTRRRYSALQNALGLYDRMLDIDQQGSISASMTVKVGEDVDKTARNMDRLSWAVNPDQLEEVSVSARFNHGKDKPWSRVSSFALSDQYRGRLQYAATSPKLEKKYLDEVIANHNRLILNIEPGGKIDTTMTAAVDLEVVKDDVQLTYMSITPYLKTTSVKLEGADIDFLQPELPGSNGLHAPYIAVLLPEKAKKGDKFTLDFEIEGKLLDRIDGFTFLIKDMDRWYPKPSSESNAPAIFDTTLIVPKDFTAVANGEKLDCTADEEIAGKECNRYKTWKPIFLSFFNLGKKMHVDRGIAPNSEKTPIEVWTNPNSTFGYGISPSKQAPNILAKVQVALNIYDEWFGPFPYAKFAVTPHPRGLGRGGASMLLLARSAFLTSTDTGNTWRPWGMDAFVSHETAHQWWGNIVGIRGDRDQWFSEGFSDYAATLHLEQVDRVSGSNWRIQEIGTWHEKLTEDDGYMNDLVPLCLGNRYMSSENRKGYEWRRQDFMYNKGGFVMNMLRTQARFQMGSKEKGDALFKQAIRNFIDEQYLKFPSNYDMQTSLSRSFGTDLRWFFKQWVYGMGIPKIEFSHELASHPDGGTLLRGRVKQRQAGKPFKFPIAVYVRQGKGKKAEEAHFYQMIETGDQTFEVGPLPWRPTEVSLNDDLGVLAIVEDVDWKGSATGM